MAKLYYEKDNAIYKSETGIPAANDAFVVDRDVIEGHALVYGKKDDAGEIEIYVSETGIPAAGDKTIDELQDAKQENCEHPKHNEDAVCTDCHKAGLEHDEEVIPAVAATCTESGLEAGKKCKVCGKITVEQKVINALGHDFDETTGKCKREGCTETDPDFVATTSVE